MSAADRRPSFSLHRAPRARPAVRVAGVERLAPEWPGLVFRLVFRRDALAFDLSGHPHPELASEAGRMIWDLHHDGSSYRSYQPAMLARLALRLLGEYLAENDPGSAVRRMRDVSVAVIDGFENWVDQRLHDRRQASWRVLNAFILILRRGTDAGLTSPAIEPRCRFTMLHHRRAETVSRAGYDDFTLAGLHAASRAAVEAAIERLRLGAEMAGRGMPTPPQGWVARENLVWHLLNRGMIHRPERAIMKQLGVPTTVALDAVYPRAPDWVPFLVLLTDDNGLPIECLRELRADCLVAAPGTTVGKLRYVKRRSHNDERVHEADVRCSELFSTGWLVERVLEMTAATRRQLGLGPREGALFLSRVNAKLGPFIPSKDAVASFLRLHPVATDANGGRLRSLSLARLRKNNKAQAFKANEGVVSKMDPDHSEGTLLRYYIQIPFLRPHHDGVVREGLEAAHMAAIRPRVLTDGQAEALARDPSRAGAGLGFTEEQSRAVGSGDADTWVASCLSFRDSPYAAAGKPCGAPVWGCLDCRNAVFTTAKLPGLLRLLNHIVAKRGQIDIEAWRRNFGYAFARLVQLLDLFPPADVAAAMKEAADDQGRDFTLAQLSHRINP